MNFKTIIFATVIGLAPVLAPIPSLADCFSPVEDQAHVIGNPSQVSDAAESLATAGMTVRVRTFPNLNGVTSLDQYVHSICSNWRNGAYWKSTLLLLVYAPNNHGQIGAYFGAANEARFGGGQWQDILRTELVPAIHAYKQGDTNALTSGFVKTLTEFKIAYLRPSTGGNVTINPPSSHSWIFFLLAIVFLVIILIAIAAWTTSRSQLQAAQAEAKRFRQRCIQGISDITDKDALTLLETKAQGNESLLMKLSTLKSLGNRALDRFNSVDSVSGADPNARILSVDAYNTNKQMYMDIFNEFITPGSHLMADIGTGRVDPFIRTSFAINPPPVTSAAAAPTYQVAPTYISGAPTVIRERVVERDNSGDLVTGMMLGEMMSERREPTVVNNYVEPEREERGGDYGGGGGSEPPQEDKDDGGSFDTSSDQSDDGGSFASDSGSSDSGGNFSSNC